MAKTRANRRYSRRHRRRDSGIVHKGTIPLSLERGIEVGEYTIRRPLHRRTQRKRGGMRWPSCTGASCTTAAVNTSAHTNTQVTALPSTENISYDSIDVVLKLADGIQERYNHAKTRKSKSNDKGAITHLKIAINLRNILNELIKRVKFEPKYEPILNALLEELTKDSFSIDSFNIIVEALKEMKNATDPQIIDSIPYIMNAKLVVNILAQPWGKRRTAVNVNNGVTNYTPHNIKTNNAELNNAELNNATAPRSTNATARPMTFQRLFKKKQNEVGIPGSVELIGGKRKYRSRKN